MFSHAEAQIANDQLPVKTINDWNSTAGIISSNSALVIVAYYMALAEPIHHFPGSNFAHWSDTGNNNSWQNSRLYSLNAIDVNLWKNF